MFKKILLKIKNFFSRYFECQKHIEYKTDKKGRRVMKCRRKIYVKIR